MKSVVLAYSGGLDTSVCVLLLKEKFGFDRVLTVTVDVGQEAADIRQAEQRARKLGALHRTVDAKKEFVTDYLWPLVKANGAYEGYVLGTAISRILIARKVVEVARREGAKAAGHGCTSKGNDQLRFETMFRAAGLRVVAPIRELGLTRKQEMDYLEKHGVSVGGKSRFSVDENLWSRSIEGAELEDPGNPVPEEAYRWTRAPERAPSPQSVTLGFRRGVPDSLDGKRMDPLALVRRLNELAGRHGVGRTDMLEDRFLGYKVREVYEHPAATVLLAAHRDLESLVLTRSELRVKAGLEQAWAELVYAGLTVDPLYDALNAFMDKTQERVAGRVTLRLSKGTARPVSRWSPHGLTTASASFDAPGDRDVEGILRLHGLQGRLARRGRWP
ncbi:MAG: argininosuccinate synthase [Halobacteria archaeon]